MAAQAHLGKISEEGLTGSAARDSLFNENGEEDVASETVRPVKESKGSKGQGRKQSVFGQDLKVKQQDKTTFALVHADQPVANRVTFASTQSEASDQLGRRVSAQEHSQRPRRNITYQTGPLREFSVKQVRKIIKETIENALNGSQVELSRSSLCKNLTEAIKIKTRRMNYDRYRLIVHVYLCSKDNLTLNITSRCVWDEKVDNYADYRYEGKDYYILGVVHGIYKE